MNICYYKKTCLRVVKEQDNLLKICQQLYISTFSLCSDPFLSSQSSFLIPRPKKWSFQFLLPSPVDFELPPTNRLAILLCFCLFSFRQESASSEQWTLAKSSIHRRFKYTNRCKILFPKPGIQKKCSPVSTSFIYMQKNHFSPI